MQYNESLYNGDSYNLTNYSATLVETIAPTDADVVKDVSVVRADSQGTADAIGGSASLQAFLETVTILQRAKTPHAYNTGMYNQYMYNARLDEDEILLMATKALVDTLTLTDSLEPFTIDKLLSEIMTETDTLSFSAQSILIEFVFLSELFNIQFTNKALNDIVRLGDWLSIKQNPQSDNWGD